MFNKIYILNTSKRSAIPANILLSGLDLARRVIQLTYSCVWFKEPFDAIIGVSLIFLGISGGLLMYQYIRDYRLGLSANLQHLPMVESDVPADPYEMKREYTQ